MNAWLTNTEQTFLGSILYYVKDNLKESFDENKVEYLMEKLIQKGITIPIIELK